MRTLSFTVCLTSSSTSSRGCRMLLPGLYWLRRRDSVRSHLTDLCWLPVRQRILQKVAVLVFRCVHGFAPRYLLRLITNRTCHRSLALRRFPDWLCPRLALFAMDGVLSLVLRPMHGIPSRTTLDRQPPSLHSSLDFGPT